MGTAFIQDLAIVMLVAGFIGLLCHRLGLSVIVGYLVAGLIIGPYTPPFSLVTDLSRIQMLADLGLAFLIFSIGLDLNIKRLQRLGTSIALATFLSAILLFNFGRLLGLALGWTGNQSMFLASVFMISSSAIISKLIQDLNLGHERSAQLALGVTVLEDTVAVIMLTLLTSLVRFGEADVGQFIPTVVSLGSFVLVLFLVALFFVPRLLGVIERAGSPEVRNLVLIGLVLGMSWLAVRAGYSIALAAFVLGAIVGSTPQKRDIERALEGLRHLFGAVFFVAMGMLLDIGLLWEALPLVALFTVFAVLFRVISSTMGLLSVGNTLRDSLAAGFNLTPIGEFSFIIAQLGVAAAIVPPTFYPAAVGVALLMALTAPMLAKNSDRLAALVERNTPEIIQSWIHVYHDSFLERLARRQHTPEARASRRHLIWGGVQLAFASALLLFAEPLYTYAAARLGENWLFPHGLKVVSGALLSLFLLPIGLAVWRHISAFGAFFLGRMTSAAGASLEKSNLVFEISVRVLAGAFLAAWFIALLPFSFSLLWSAIIGVGVLSALAVGLWRPVARLHGRFETQIRDQLHAAQSPPSAVGLARALKDRPSEWNVRLEEVVVPHLATYAGKSIGAIAFRPQFGCSVVGIDRSGFVILNPSHEQALYPGDRLLLLGTMEQVEVAEAFVRSPGANLTASRSERFDELTFESHIVAEGSCVEDVPLRDLDLVGRFGVQVGAIRRDGAQLPPPSGTSRLSSKDEVLIVGTAQAIRDFLVWMNARPCTENSENPHNPQNPS